MGITRVLHPIRLWAFVAVAIACVLHSSVPAAAEEDLWQYQGSAGNSVIAWSEQGIDFPSFFAPENRQCLVTSLQCDTVHAPMGHGFVDYSVCDSAAELFCIESMSISKNGKPVSTQLVEEVEWQKIVVPLEHGLIRGGGPTIWSTDIDGVKQLYAVKAFSGFSWNQGPAHVDKLEIVITPVRLGAGRCSLHSSHGCFMEQSFNDGDRASITLRLPANLGGFFMGRIGNAVVKQFSSTDGYSRVVELSADPVEVPRAAVSIMAGESGLTGLCPAGNVCRFPAYDGGALGEGGYSPAWKETLVNSGNRSQGRGRVWRVYAMSPQSTEYRGCTNEVPGFLGVGSTNALLYDYNPPKYSSGNFVFKVGGLHFKMDGSLELGSYQVKISSAFARCLYGFTSAPISAIISISDEAGTQTNAITSVGESGGWLNIVATGFTFSSPTISVKLSQAKAAAVKTTITCTKGKLTKKVTAVGPKCPVGYKTK